LARIDSLGPSHPADPRLTECRGVKSHDIELAHRAAEDGPSTAHQELPTSNLDAEPLEDRRKRWIDGTALVLSDQSSTPIHQRQVVAKGVRNGWYVLLHFIAERAQGNDRVRFLS